MEEIVGTHHNSFCGSIKKYADVVRLLERSQNNVSSLRTMFDGTRTQLAAGIDHQGTIKTPWGQSVVLQELTRRLDEIERLTHVPEKILSLMSNGQYLPSVKLAVASCSKLASPEYAMVDVALQDLRREFTACREILRNQVLSELVKTIFCRHLKCRRASEALWTGDRGERSRATSEYLDLSSSSDEETTDNLVFAREDDDEFLLETTRDVQDTHHACITEQIDNLVACMVELGDASLTRVTFEHTVHTEVFELVRDELLHCRARKDVLRLLASKVVQDEDDAVNDEESFPVAELVIDHIFCLFRLVLLNLAKLETLLGECGVDHVDERESQPRIVSCAVHAMETSFMRAVEGLLLHVDGPRSQKESHRWDVLSRSSHGASGQGSGGHPESEEASELPTFMFQGARVYGDGDDDRKLRSDEKSKAVNDAVYTAAQHLRAALGIPSTLHLGMFDARLVRELLAEITPRFTAPR